MKLIIGLLLLIILLTTQCLNAQTKNIYLTKSKHQKTAAWALLGGGVGLGLVGAIVGIHGVVNLATGQFDKVDNNIGAGSILITTGGAAILGSIPLFIAAGKNKRREMSLSFTNQPTSVLVKNIMGNRYVPSISVKFNL